MTSPKPELVIVGAGAVARTLGRVLQHSGAFSVTAIVGRNPARAEEAASFIAQGGGSQAPEVRSELKGAVGPGATVMIATPDRHIERVAGDLASDKLLDADSVVFHCSGALASSVLEACRKRGAALASVHPLASFADPTRLARQFQGVYCVTEGDARALDTLEPCFLLAGAKLVRLTAATKALYHAGAVFASGHVATVLGAAMAAQRAAGISDSKAREMLAPLIRITLENVLQQGAVAAMTGPLPRGDEAVVLGHHQALMAADPELARCYAALTRYAAALLLRPDPLGDKT